LPVEVLIIPDRARRSPGVEGAAWVAKPGEHNSNETNIIVITARYPNVRFICGPPQKIQQ
jgi:hypothetical protein